MNPDRTILTWHADRWHDGNVPILGAADHATWLGTLVFDGARRFEGVTPDLDAHVERVDRSARALGMTPSLPVARIIELAREGLSRIPSTEAIYIRPMYWSTGFGAGFISADPDSTDFCLCLEAIPMPATTASATLGTTRFRRPTLDVATVDAKAACLYPNNARMIREAISRGFSNAIVMDALGNVAESATSNLFLVRDGEIFTPQPNGTFLNGITRKRCLALCRASGIAVHETTLTLADFQAADEVFMSGNLTKIMPVVQVEASNLQQGPVTRRLREHYWDWALSAIDDLPLEPVR